MKNNCEVNQAVADLVIEDMVIRKQLGLERYGRYLTTHNGRNGLQDLYEELLDACMYIKQVLLEQEVDENGLS